MRRENDKARIGALVFIGDDLCAGAGELGVRNVPAFIGGRHPGRAADQTQRARGAPNEMAGLLGKKLKTTPCKVGVARRDKPKIVPWENPFDKMELSYKRKNSRSQTKGRDNGEHKLDLHRRASPRPYVTDLDSAI